MMSKYKNNCRAKAIAYSALILGAGSLSLFAAFLYSGSFSFFTFGMSGPIILLFDAGLCMIFFIQHSAMLRQWFRKHTLNFIPAPYFGAVYAIASGITLLILLIFWQKSASAVISANGVNRWFFRFLFLASIAGFIWSTRSLGAFDPFGVKNIFYHINNKQPKILPLAIRGPYKLVRHPLYFFSLMMIWYWPDLSADRLVFNMLWTGWIIIGTLLEERDLVREFGEDYRDYQRAVPMLIPFKIFNKNP
jgi:methanethiol S-methyltransferase